MAFLAVDSIPFSVPFYSFFPYMSLPHLGSSNSLDIPRTDTLWVDPFVLPDASHPFEISGNAPDLVKQLNYNTFVSYGHFVPPITHHLFSFSWTGVGDPHSFGHLVGKSVKFVDVSLDRNLDRCGRMEATTVAEVTVNKRSCTSSSFLTLLICEQRYVEWSQYAAWRCSRIPHRQVS